METIAAGVDAFVTSHRALEVVPHAVWDALQSRSFKGSTVPSVFNGRGDGLGGQWTTLREEPALLVIYCLYSCTG